MKKRTIEDKINTICGSVVFVLFLVFVNVCMALTA